MTASSFHILAERLQPTIERALADACQLPADCPRPLREAMAYGLLAPGKRLRPMLALLAAEACCGGDPAAALPAACAVEMVHAYSLIHDDLPAMDDDDLRRGRPTCHKVFGEAMAILAGDALLTLAFEVLAKRVQPAVAAAASCAALAEAAGACRLVGGQADDMLAGETAADDVIGDDADGDLAEEPLAGAAEAATATGCATETLAAARLAHLHRIHHRKTGAMIGVSLRLGAIAVGADDEQIAALHAYGERLGLAFQITDDLLDARGTEAEVGKRVGKDHQRGKLTFPALLGLDRSAARAAELIDEACQSLERFSRHAEGLRVLARYVLERNR